jgi:hypothetical protein
MGRKGTDDVRYDWSSMPSVLSPEETTARLAEVERHDRQKSKLDSGHTLRLVLAAPIAVWSLGLMAVVILAVILPVMQLLWGAVSDFEVDGWLVVFVAVVVLAEVASIWSGSILIKDTVRPRAWLVIGMLAGAALAGAVVMLVAGGDAQDVDLLGIGAMTYVLVVALVQLARARRLAGAAAEVEGWNP